MVAGQNVDTQHQNHADMYCAVYGDYYPENQYYVHGGPPEMCPAHVCAMQSEFGPVTVPMVSTNSTPPIAMPVQVPAGHVLQQVVDESGTLRHLIISTHTPGLVPLPSHNAPHFGAGPGNSTNQGPAFYQSMTTGYPHFPNMPPGHPAGPSPTHPGLSPTSTYYKDERQQRQHIKLKKKFQDKQQQNNNTKLPETGASLTSTTTNTTATVPTNARKDLLTNGLRTTAPTTSAKEKDMNSVGTSEDGEESSVPDEDDVQIIADILSSVQAPKVSELSSRSALLQWAPPTRLTQSSPTTAETPEINMNELRYEILLSDKSKESKYKLIYSGASLSCRIRDLKPGQEYSVCLQVHFEELQGSASDRVRFTTPACEPDQPLPPKLHLKQKTSLHLKWQPVLDNGSPITHYILKYDEGKAGGDFIEFHRSSGKVRQYTLNKLQPATAYRFQISALNAVGVSTPSEAVAYTTSSTAPSRPDPPALVEALVDRLHVAWPRRPTDDDYTLEVDGSARGAHERFLADDRVHCICAPLRRATEYRFRLKAANDGGQSPWSEEAAYRTPADRPARPSKPVVRGRIHAHSFRLRWEPPADTGGAPIGEYLLEVNSGRGYEPVYRGGETEALCDKLSPGTTYQLRVSCASEGGRSNYSDPCTVTTDAIAPGECPPVRVNGRVRADAVPVVWGEPDYNGGAPVLEYEVAMGRVGGEREVGEGERVIVHKGRGIECEVGGLAPGVEYEFVVRAVNRVGPGGWSKEVRVTSGAAPPDAPTMPSVECRSAVQCGVGWRAPKANGAPVGEYRLEAGMRQCDDEFRVVYQGAETTFEVKGLNPFSTYYFRVQAINSAGCSAYSDVAGTVTPAAAPAAVTTLRGDATPTTIALNWSEPACHGSPITHYNIEFGDKLISTDQPTNEYLLDNLQPDTNYKIKVQACNDIGNSGFSSVLRIATLRLPPSAPRLECIGYGHNYLKLKWGDGKNLDYTQYVVEMEHHHEFHCVYKGTALNYKVNKLNELQTYRFQICATNDAGTGDYSMIYEFETLIAPPAAVKQPKVVEIEQRSAAIEWNQSRNQFVDSIEYQVQLARTKELNYREVYRGAETKCTIGELEPGQEYSARVTPIRLTQTAGDLNGPISPPLSFGTQPAEIVAAKSQNQSISTISASSHHRHHRTQFGSLLQLNCWKLFSNKPVFYAILITILGIILSIWMTTFFN